MKSLQLLRYHSSNVVNDYDDIMANMIYLRLVIQRCYFKCEIVQSQQNWRQQNNTLLVKTLPGNQTEDRAQPSENQVALITFELLRNMIMKIMIMMVSAIVKTIVDARREENHSRKRIIFPNPTTFLRSRINVADFVMLQCFAYAD